MRRMNPRDTRMAVLTDVNIHRIIRRSTTYGAPYHPNALSPQDDETPRGLHFIFISAKAMATMEFLQQEWINKRQLPAPRRGARSERRPAGGRGHIHDP
jgi:deferrochelatase/peroxidase EfeB